jgi:putative ABC transport system substrate-binding protein
MAINIARRQFIAAFSGGAVWPLAARAQPTNRIRLIGLLMGFAESDPTARSMVEAFRSALPKLGVDGRQQRAHRSSLGRL